jgi:hypothetical protein
MICRTAQNSTGREINRLEARNLRLFAQFLCCLRFWLFCDRIKHKNIDYLAKQNVLYNIAHLYNASFLGEHASGVAEALSVAIIIFMNAMHVAS